MHVCMYVGMYIQLGLGICPYYHFTVLAQHSNNSTAVMYHISKNCIPRLGMVTFGIVYMKLVLMLHNDCMYSICSDIFNFNLSFEFASPKGLIFNWLNQLTSNSLTIYFLFFLSNQLERQFMIQITNPL